MSLGFPLTAWLENPKDMSSVHVNRATKNPKDLSLGFPLTTWLEIQMHLKRVRVALNGNTIFSGLPDDKEKVFSLENLVSLSLEAMEAKKGRLVFFYTVYRYKQFPEWSFVIRIEKRKGHVLIRKIV